MILYTKSNCSTCLLVKEYLEMIKVEYQTINIDSRIPASLVEAMNNPDFPDKFLYPIMVNGDDIYFGEECLQFK